ncbi:MAG: putative aldouronate transport system substrate-binding protein [Clostridiales bacterium]|jgi:putative aldouronate transport system substrate-binding protein|nr:putative aldouronate transport system substrate-binding protein [Clostridiales bacterium]
MKKTLINVLAMGLLVVMLLSLAIGCQSSDGSVESKDTETSTDGQQENGGQEAQQSEQKEPVRIVTSVVGGKDPDENKLFEQEVKRLTGIQIEIIKPPSTEYDQKVATMLAGGEKVDLIYTGATQFEKLFPQGFFEPLTDRIKNSEVLSDPNIIDPKEWDRITREDGNIYAVFNKDEGGTLPIVRWDWMQKLKLEPPQTLDEYYEVLKAFAERDPDGNGKKDTYGLTLSKLYDIQPFMGVYGLIGKHAQDDNGQWYIPWATDQAIPVYEWLAKLYKEGILDPNFATNTTANERELFMNDKVGMMVYWAAWVGMFNDQVRSEEPNTTFEAKGIEPPKGPNGEALLMAGEDGLWVIPKNSANKDLAFKFLEFWHTEEGNILGTLGILNHDYKLENDKYVLTEVGKSHAMDHGAPYPKSLKWVNPIGTPLNFEDANQIVKKYAKPQTARADTVDAMSIVDKYGIKAVLGELSAQDAVKAMRAELKSKGYIDIE